MGVGCLRGSAATRLWHGTLLLVPYVARTSGVAFVVMLERPSNTPARLPEQARLGVPTGLGMARSWGCSTEMLKKLRRETLSRVVDARLVRNFLYMPHRVGCAHAAGSALESGGGHARRATLRVVSLCAHGRRASMLRLIRLGERAVREQAMGARSLGAPMAGCCGMARSW